MLTGVIFYPPKVLWLKVLTAVKQQKRWRTGKLKGNVYSLHVSQLHNHLLPYALPALFAHNPACL